MGSLNKYQVKRLFQKKRNNLHKSNIYAVEVPVLSGVKTVQHLDKKTFEILKTFDQVFAEG